MSVSVCVCVWLIDFEGALSGIHVAKRLAKCKRNRFVFGKRYQVGSFSKPSLAVRHFGQKRGCFCFSAGCAALLCSVASETRFVDCAWCRFGDEIYKYGGRRKKRTEEQKRDVRIATMCLLFVQVNYGKPGRRMWKVGCQGY